MRLEHRYLVWTAVLAAALAVYAQVRDNEEQSLNEGRSAPFAATLTVQEAGRDGAWREFYARHLKMRLKVVFKAEPGVPPPEAGDIFEVRGWLGNAEGGARKLWVIEPGDYARKTGERRLKPLIGLAARLRRDFSRRLGLGLERDGDAAGLNRAILLGERYRVGREAREVFIAAGTMHVFAVSGLHVMMVAKLLMVAMALCWVPPRWAAAALIPVLWLYVLIAGSAPSAVRAATMASFYFAALLFGRQPNATIAWALAFAAMHLANPFNILDAGSLLSFAVMLGLLLMGEYLKPFARTPWAFAAYSFAAWAAGVPIVAHIFGRVTPGGLFANLLLLPLAAIEVALGFAGLAASFVFTPLAQLINGAAALTVRLMYALSYAVSSLPFANVEVKAWGVWDSLRWYALVALTLYLIRIVYLRRRAELK